MLDDMEVFERVVREGGFTPAARALGIAKATASARVARLEERLGVRLLHRTTRVVRPTDLGLAYARRCAAILADVREAELAVAAAVPRPHGVLRVTCPRLFGTAFLTPVVAEYCRLHPEVGLELSLTERQVDLVDEGYDLAIRLGPLQDSALVARKLGAAALVAVASPSVARDHPDAAEAPWVAVGVSRSVRVGPRSVRARIAVDSLEMARDLAVAGLGIAQVPRFLCHAQLGAGQLVEPWPDLAVAGFGIHAVYPPHRQLSARVRAFLELLDGLARDAPWGPPGSADKI